MHLSPGHIHSNNTSQALIFVFVPNVLEHKSTEKSREACPLEASNSVTPSRMHPFFLTF